jgi:hypothetical protein
MSALENTVRVSSEKQTLILAGEPVPQRGGIAGPRSFAYIDSQRPLTIIAYARTQELASASARSAIIDTYA